MWITEKTLEMVLITYLILGVLGLLSIIYSKNLTFKEKLLRLIILVFIPVIGIVIVLAEKTFWYAKELGLRSSS